MAPPSRPARRPPVLREPRPARHALEGLPTCRSRSNRTCGTPIPSGCSPSSAASSAGCTPRRAQRVAHHGRLQRQRPRAVPERERPCSRRRRCRPGTVVHNAYGYGLFTGGLGLHGGAELLGCAVVPMSGGQTARQVLLIGDLRPEVLCCTPSYAALLGETMEARDHPGGKPLPGRDLRGRALERAAAPPHRSPARHQALDIYGLCEVIGPGVAFECLESRAELPPEGWAVCT